MITSINTADEGKLFEIWPNPTTGRLTLTGEFSGKTKSAVIFNLIGQKIYSYRLNNSKNYEELDLTFLPNGLYILKLIDSERIVLQKRLIVSK